MIKTIQIDIPALSHALNLPEGIEVVNVDKVLNHFGNYALEVKLSGEDFGQYNEAESPINPLLITPYYVDNEFKTAPVWEFDKKFDQVVEYNNQRAYGEVVDKTELQELGEKYVKLGMLLKNKNASISEVDEAARELDITLSLVSWE